MRWNRCNCESRFLVRLDRLPWMRFIPGRRHYYCALCEVHQFLSRRLVRKSLPSSTSAHLHASATIHSPLH